MYHASDSYYNTHEEITPPVIIRPANGDDADALRHLAQRDTAPLPTGEMLVAIEGGEIRAAASVETGETVADPFHRTAELVHILSLRLAQLRPAA
jgi:hypothetical protein